jgi:hypothetical protein
MTSFAVQLSYCSDIPPWTYIGPLCGLVLVYRGSVCREKMVLHGITYCRATLVVARFAHGIGRQRGDHKGRPYDMQIGQAVVSFIISSAARPMMAYGLPSVSPIS